MKFLVEKDNMFNGVKIVERALKRVSINKSSGNKVLDDEIFRVLSQEVKYMPTPNKTDQSLWLTFNIKK